MRGLHRHGSLLVGAALVTVVVATALLAPWVSPYDPVVQNTRGRLLPASVAHLLGTDEYGRDVLARSAWGGRTTLTITSVSILVSALVGVIFGTTSAYVGRRVGRIIDGVTDLLLVFPTLVLSLAFVVALGQGVRSIIAAMTIAFVPQFTRLARGSALAIKAEAFVEASRALGAGDPRIIFRHILPNCASELVVMGTLWLGIGVEIEASLSFLGLGVPEPFPSWGLMVRNGFKYLLTNPVLAIYPAAAIFITVLGLNLLGDALRERLDPALRNR